MSTKEMGAREQRLRDPASCPRGYRETLEYAQSLTGGRVLDTDLSACIRHGVLTSIHAIIHTQLATHSGTAACSGSTPTPTLLSVGRHTAPRLFSGRRRPRGSF